jgi:hypothetical protein
MAYKHYTQCYSYPSGGKPYNEGDRVAFIIIQLLKAAAIGGTFALAGLVAGPIGAIIGGILGSIVGVTDLIDTAADQWLNHRLICLGGDPLCAVGIVSFNPAKSEWDVFDNDQFFDAVLMPHPIELADVSEQTGFDPESDKAITGKAIVAANRYKADGSVVDGFSANVGKHPANDILRDGFQGQELLAPRADIQADIDYAPISQHERSALHCEAEGDFWVRMKKLSPALAILLVAALITTIAVATAAGTAGAALGCTIGVFFFGPLGCAIGAFFGGLLGAAAGAAAVGAATYFGAIQPILKAIFDAAPGNVEDANVGDTSLGPIGMGDRVVVMGLHIYDGYHDGWHEFHPLMAVVKIARPEGEPDFYLQWQPTFADDGKPPSPPPGEAIVLTPDDMRKGLNSDAFRKRCENLRRTWCRMLNEAFDPETRKTQQGLDQRWTIHPFVDGCRPAAPDPDGPH